MRGRSRPSVCPSIDQDSAGGGGGRGSRGLLQLQQILSPEAGCCWRGDAAREYLSYTSSYLIFHEPLSAMWRLIAQSAKRRAWADAGQWTAQPQGRLAVRAPGPLRGLAACACFAVSGAIHEVMYWYCERRLTGHWFAFFVLQAGPAAAPCHARPSPPLQTCDLARNLSCPSTHNSHWGLRGSVAELGG